MKYFDKPTQLGKYTIANVREYNPKKSHCLYIIQPEELSSFQQKYPQSKQIKQIKTPQNISKIVLINDF
jgi:hypothetical protein